MTDDAQDDREVKPAEVETTTPEPADPEAETDPGDQPTDVDYVTGSMARGIDETYNELERLPD